MSRSMIAPALTPGLSKAMLDADLVDVCTPFVKNEPHPSRKRGRERIVIAISIVDQLVELYLFGKLLDVVHEGYPNLGVISGLGFSDEHSAELCTVYKDKCDEYKDTRLAVISDVTGWDRTLSHQALDDMGDIIVNTCVDIGPASERAVRVRLRCISCPVYVVELEPGVWHLFERAIPGGMLSGSRLTTIGNGIARARSQFMTGAQGGMVNGDDGIAWQLLGTDVEEIQSAYALLGIQARDIKVCTREYFEFCSHGFDTTAGVSWLLSWPKALFRLASKEKIPESYVEDFVREVINHPRRDELLGAVDRLFSAAAVG